MEHGYMYNVAQVYTRNRLIAADDEEDCDDNSEEALLPYKYKRYRRYANYTSSGEGEKRRSALGVVFKVTLFCTAMILFCVLMYIPMYNKVIEHSPKDIVAGWSIHTSRDTKIYVQPNNLTVIHEPFNPCYSSEDERGKLYLLIVVCSSTENFDRRLAIRETWGNYDSYVKMTELHKEAVNRYKNYTEDFSPEPSNEHVVFGTEKNVSAPSDGRSKRSVGYSVLLPKLAEVLKKSLVTVKITTAVDEKRFEDDINGPADFDMNKELEKSAVRSYDDDYESHVMRISPDGTQDTPDLTQILKILKKSDLEIEDEQIEPQVDFKLIFLMGRPANNSELQAKIDDEVEKYGDIVQENFIDSYNNLTLKSLMMLKWVTGHCYEDNLRYIMKTDDDMYVNIVNIMSVLRNRSAEYDQKQHRPGEKEYLLTGSLIRGAKPVLDSTNKWFSPPYMYGGRVYPWYLSGTAYILSLPTARAIYKAALYTPLFHLEDVFITGICALRASPPQRPSQGAWFYLRGAPNSPEAVAVAACVALRRAALHRVTTQRLRLLHAALLQPHTHLRRRKALSRFLGMCSSGDAHNNPLSKRPSGKPPYGIFDLSSNTPILLS